MKMYLESCFAVGVFSKPGLVNFMVIIYVNLNNMHVKVDF